MVATFIREVLARARRSLASIRGVRGGSATIAALVVGSVSALVVAASGVMWSVNTAADAGVARVGSLNDIETRPPQTANGSVDILFAATDDPVEEKADDDKETKSAGDEELPDRRLSHLALVHLSRRHDSTVLVDLPSNSLVQVPAHRDADGKEVAAASRPLAAAYEDGGPALVVQALETVTEIRVDGYVELSLPALTDVVAALDGIELCLPKTVEDKASKLRLAPGEQTITADQVAAYARTTVGGPLDRLRRTQLLFGAAAELLFGPTAALTPWQATPLLDEGAAALRVDDGFDRALARRLALALRDPYGDHTSIVSVPVDETKKTKDGTVTTWQSQLTGYLFEELGEDARIDPSLFTPAPVPLRPGSVGFRVENGAGVEGLATKASEDLRGVGFRMTGAPSNAAQETATTTIYHDAAHEKHARTIQAAIPGAELAVTKTRTSTMRVVVGRSYSGVRQVNYVKNAEPGVTENDALSVTAAGPCGG